MNTPRYLSTGLTRPISAFALVALIATAVFSTSSSAKLVGNFISAGKADSTLSAKAFPTGVRASAMGAFASPAAALDETVQRIATILTDKPDYEPGEVVTMSGTGWTPGERVTMLLHEELDPQVRPDRTFVAYADMDGKIVNAEFSPEEHHRGVSFILTATGENSGLTAQTTFTDANSSSGCQVTFAASPLFTVCPGQQVTLTAQVNSVGGTNPAALSYQWYRTNNTNNNSFNPANFSPITNAEIPGAVGTVTTLANGTATITLTFTPNATTDSGKRFAVLVSGPAATFCSGTHNSGGGQNQVTYNGNVSNNATLTVLSAPSVVTSPVDYTANVLVGSTTAPASFTVTSNYSASTGPVTYTWQVFNAGTNQWNTVQTTANSTSTTNTYAPTVGASDSGKQYRALVSTGCSSAAPSSVATLTVVLPDADNDGVLDNVDNCSAVANANQLNTDGDAQGDACDADDDSDGALDTADNCPLTANALQADLDLDGIGDACDSDTDGDGAANNADCAQLDANVHPGATEIPYNNVDENCDGIVLMDVDGDGANGGPNGTDCNDGDNTIHPGATEVPYDGIDQNCNGLDLTDVDQDGVNGGPNGTDCDDNNAGRYPGLAEIANDGIDQNCNNKDTVTVHLDGLTQTYNGSPRAATATPANLNISLVYTGIAPTSYSASSNAPTNAGSYSVTATVNEAAAEGSASGTLNVAKANQTITFAQPAGPKVFGSTFSVAPASDSNLPVSVAASNGCTLSGGTVTMTSGTDACVLTASQGGDDNYNAADDVEHTVAASKAAATISVVGFSGTYDGQPHGAVSESATGLDSTDLSSLLSVTGSHTDAPGGTINWSFTGNDDYSSGSGTATVTINKANATITVNGYTGTYDAAAHGATGSATGVGGVDLIGQLSLGSSYTDAPGGTANWSFSGGTNYNNDSGSVAITINKAAANISVTGFNGFYDGAPHGATGSATGVGGVDLSSQLSFTNNSYTNVPGGTANWSFSGGTNYNSDSGTAQIAIKKWDINGFYQPVDMTPAGATALTLNTIKGGSTVPLKFEIFAGTEEKTTTAAIADQGGFQWKEFNCAASLATLSDVELLTTGGTSLRYDSVAGQFIQNWQTPKTAGKCYQVRLTAKDGSKIDAYFKTK